jgi:hypothetical protein
MLTRDQAQTQCSNPLTARSTSASTTPQTADFAVLALTFALALALCSCLQDFLYLSYSSCACHTYVTSRSGEQYRTLSKQQSPPPAQSRVPHANPRVRGSTEKKQATLSSCVKICTRFRSAFLLCAPETGISVLVAPEYALRATLRATAWPKRLPPGLRFTFHPRHGRVAEVRI